MAGGWGRLHKAGEHGHWTGGRGRGGGRNLVSLRSSHLLLPGLNVCKMADVPFSEVAA